MVALAAAALLALGGMGLAGTSAAAASTGSPASTTPPTTTTTGTTGTTPTTTTPAASPSPSSPSTPTSPSTPSAPTSPPTPTTAPHPPLTPTRVVRLPPTAIADGTDPLVVTLSAPPAGDSPRPMLEPAVAGSWRVAGDSEVFTAAATLAPCSTYTLTVWANTVATGHARVGRKRSVKLQVACPPVAGLQEAFARLGYLGAKLHPTYRVHLPHDGRESMRAAAQQAYRPFRGGLAPEPSDAPPVQLGTLDATTRGAIEVFQADHRLPMTGAPNALMWRVLLEVEGLYHRDPHPYTWVSVTESLPETMELHEGSRVVVSSPANTGVAGAETEKGIFPIYARYVSTTMTGTDPDGEHYVAPDVPWVNYFNGGDAVHGYPRASYGFPQSNGCVELPIGTADEIFPMLAIGDVVWVQ